MRGSREGAAGLCLSVRWHPPSPRAPFMPSCTEGSGCRDHKCHWHLDRREPEARRRQAHGQHGVRTPVPGLPGCGSASP